MKIKTSDPDRIKPADMRETHPLDALFTMRSKLLKGILIALSMLGLPALIIACIEAVKLNQITGVILYIVVYLLVLTATLGFNRLPFALCAGVMLGGLYVMALFNLMHFSFAGAGITIFVALCVLATVLLGIRTGFAVAGLCLVSLVGAGICFVHDILPVTPGMPATTDQLISWITAAGVFLLLSGSLILGAGMLQEHLIHSVTTVHHQAEELTHANEQLSTEIQQRTLAQKKRRQSDLQFRTLFEVAPDAMYLTDLEGTFIDGNNAAETLMGISRDRFIGKSFADLNILPPEELPKAITLLETNIQGKMTGPDEVTLITQNDKKIVVEIRTCPFQLNDQPVILGIARDVSERKRLEAHFNQARKMESVGRLAGGVAHDFNNMLSIILGNAELALDQTDPNDFLHHSLREIIKAAQHSADVTSQLLAFARKQTAAPQVIDLNKTIETMR
ncbi:MAG: PAS domain S-box protein, partial [Desulfobacteraceae bacterium]|nr:PAS domain S-box protein [Desulfobacteraceae bacterium]